MSPIHKWSQGALIVPHKRHQLLCKTQAIAAKSHYEKLKTAEGELAQC